MALTRTMGDLIGLCQRRSDKETEGEGHIDSSEWKELISEAYGDLHGAVAETGARYFETEATITANGASSYSLPSDHLSTVGVDLVLDSTGRRRELAELMVQERTLFAGRTGQAYMFAFTGTNIALYPTPSSGTYKHIYVPQPTDYSGVSLTTDIDVINNDGLKFIVWSVASVALHKSSSDQQRAMIERDASRARLVAWATARALTMPKRHIVREDDLRGLQDGLFSPASWLFR